VSTTTFQIGQTVVFAGLDSIVCFFFSRGGLVAYLLDSGADRLLMCMP